MKPRVLYTVTVFLLTSLAMKPGDAWAGQQPLDASELEAFAEKTLEAYGVPGAGIVVVQDGEVILSRGIGVRDIGDPESKVDADTLFQLASVTKTFTAAAVAAAVDAGKLQWDQRALEVLPDFQLMDECATKNATPVDFLVHRAGFRQFFGDIFDHLGFSRAEILGRLRFAKPAYSFRDFPQYSNIGFFLAGECAAHAMGGTFEEVVEANILKPLKMDRTGRAEDLVEEPNFAKPHAMVDGKNSVVPNNLSGVFVSAGGLASSASDLTNYLLCLTANGEWDGKQLLSEESVERIFTPVIAAELSFAEVLPISDGTGFEYSPGWGIYHYNNHRVAEKGGALDGFRTVLCVLPDKNLGIAVICNQNLTLFPEAFRAYVLQKAIGIPGEEDFQEAIRESAEQVAQIFATELRPPEDAKPVARSFDAFMGSYESDLFGVWKVEKNSGDDAEAFPLLLVAGPAKYHGKLRTWDGDTLAVEWPITISFPTELEFEFADGAEQAKSFTYDGYEFSRTE